MTTYATHKSMMPGRATKSEAINRRTAARRGDKDKRNDNEMYVKWIPVVVPAFAVLMAVLAYIIVGTLI